MRFGELRQGADTGDGRSVDVRMDRREFGAFGLVVQALVKQYPPGGEHTVPSRERFSTMLARDGLVRALTTAQVGKRGSLVTLSEVGLADTAEALGNYPTTGVVYTLREATDPSTIPVTVQTVQGMEAEVVSFIAVHGLDQE